MHVDALWSDRDTLAALADLPVVRLDRIPSAEVPARALEIAAAGCHSLALVPLPAHPQAVWVAALLVRASRRLFPDSPVPVIGAHGASAMWCIVRGPSHYMGMAPSGDPSGSDEAVVARVQRAREASIRRCWPFPPLARDKCHGAHAWAILDSLPVTPETRRHALAVARTIADLAGSADVRRIDLAEALSFMGELL
ncbi:MAG: hypothetical protein HQL38_03085 [Alphaproteobacteria bacterium]|nr:hypothetical protein [Alphaproteobacteria bacterium]